MPLSKAEREQVKAKFHGRCAYCGEDLPKRWHADHMEAVQRLSKWQHGKGWVQTKMLNPDHDVIANMMPACPPCNIDKGPMPLEAWRDKLHRATEVLRRNNPTYRHALRFGLIRETKVTIQFHFERVRWNRKERPHGPE